MRVALVNPPHPYLIQPDSQAPLGLLYLASVLRLAGYDATLVNLSSTPEADAIRRIPTDCELYGFTATCMDYAACEQLAHALKDRQPGAVCALGGPHPTVAPEMVDADVFDTVCVGEGERVILDMVADMRRGALRSRYVAKRIRHLDTLPAPARDLMDTIGGSVFSHGTHYAGKTSTVIIGSRGCPFDCAFCASQAAWGGRVAFRSVMNIVDEVKRVRDETGLREFRFSDDTLNLRRNRLHALCDGLEPLGVFWRASVRAGISTEDDFRRMYDAGCREISPGIESGDQRVLDVLRKGTTAEQNRELCNLATRAGLKVRVLLMTGTPGEQSDTPEKTRDFLASVDYTLVSLMQFRPLPGSAIWRDPARFACRILDRNFSRYNVCFWRRGVNGEREETPVRACIETDDMPRDALADNMRRMRDYVLDTGKGNTG